MSALELAGTGIVDLRPHFFYFTLATTTDLIFGEPVRAQGEDVQESFATNFDYAYYVSAIRSWLADFHWLYKTRKFKNACAVVKQYASYFVSQALKDKQDNGEESISGSHASILDLYEGLKDPEVLNRLRKEIAVVLQDGEEITRAHIRNIKYLKCVILETQRLCPQLPVNVRVATKTTLLPTGGGPDRTAPVLIRKGTGVGYSVYHMHRLASIYGADANKFVPERWENTDLEEKVDWGFMPFHGGPRICLGKDFALMEASYGIVKIVQTFPELQLSPDIEIVEPGQERQNLMIVVSSAEGCKVILR
ncbi:cytochrome P450 alkane hydroxylase [Cadophora sp. MPI-SDFR-AT-0126]|nr:cytochrome P450 alkane hydroxylase [Leotiomycetes sp. MPI-SDFR-AT-0126]